MTTLGSRLYEERKARGYSVEEIAKATKIRKEFLAALEKGEYKKLPSAAYVQGFVKNYVNFLGLPEKELLALFRREFNENEYLGVLPESISRSKEISVNKVRIRQTVFLVGAVVLVVLLYLFFQYRSAFFSPSLNITSPAEKAVINTRIA